MNLATLAEEVLVRWGEHPVLAFEGREWTNADMQRAAARLAHGLVRLGLGPGDRAVVLLPNCPEVLQAYAAILKLGGVIVPVVFLLNPEEVRHILADSGARVVITAPEFLPKVEGWKGPVILVGDGPGGRAWDAVVAGQPDRFPSVDRADDDITVLLYTSGTTGRPKGVALSHANLAANARAAASLYELTMRPEWAEDAIVSKLKRELVNQYGIGRLESALAELMADSEEHHIPRDIAERVKSHAV